MPWDAIRGQNAAREQLTAAARAGRLGQAYLLAGPPGVGKRLFARELTKALLCEASPGLLEACGHCPGCVQVAADTHPDVLVLRTPEGKHELPVAAMRGFCAGMSLKPTRGGRKVGIVEDADEFNAESANAFLKTLEEPPPRSLLLLRATGTDRQLPTILSRCQIVRFASLRDDDLRAVLAEHGVEDEEKLDRLVRLAGGSAGRAVALADDAVWEVRETLLDGLAGPRPDFDALAKAWTGFVEGAGKDTAVQRQRASLVVGFLTNAVRQAVRASVGVENTDRRAGALAAKHGPDRLLELADKCVEADRLIARRVQLVLVTEVVLEAFTRP